MGIVSRMVSKSYSMDDFDRSVRERIQQSGTASKMDVNEEKALRYITVYSCARVLSEALASLPLFVYKERTSGRGADKARDHPVYSLLHDLPNDEMTSMSWRESQMGHHVISGNNYSLITLNGRGEVVDLYPVDWNQMEPTRNKEGKLVYELNDRGKVEIYPAEKVFHVPGWGFDGIKGYSPIRMASEAIGMGMAATEFVARFYGQGMNIGSVLEHPEALSDTAHNRLREWLEAKGSGLANSWRPLILEEGMKFNRIPMPLADAQFIETRKLNRDELCGLFRVPPHMVANMENATFSNIEHQDLSFVKHTLLPYIQRWEQVINWKLFTPKEREQGYYAKFNVEGLLRGDYKSRQEGLAIQRQNGVINANDWLAKEDENPIEGRAGEVYLVNGNMTPTDLANGKPSKQSTSTEGGED